MTKKRLRTTTFWVMGVYAAAILAGVLLRLLAPADRNPYYEVYKDVIPFIFGIPAAYLGYCFQQRGSYLQSLRALWSQMVAAVAQANLYTAYEKPSQEQYFAVLNQLSIAIDELRGVYKNLGEKPGEIGIYPYEPIKDIYKVVEELGCQGADEETRAQASKRITGYWRSIRQNFLSEFDRAEPSKIVSRYIE